MKKILTISLIAFTAVSTANAQIASKDYVDGKDSAMGTRVGAVETLVGNTAVATQIATAVNAEASAREDADSAITTIIGQIPEGATATTIVGYINEKATAAQTASTYTADGATVTLTGNQFSATTGNIVENGTGLATTGTIYTAIENAKSAAATDAQNKVDALANAQVATNTSDIATLKGTASTAGSVAKAEADAKAYADSLAVNYDVAGAASTAETNAKNYTDAQMNATTGTLVKHAAGEAAGSATNPVYIASDGTATAITSYPATGVTEDTTHRFVTDTDKSAWDAKQDAIGASIGSDGIYVLTANVVNGVVSGYQWEQITDRTAQPGA